MDAPNFSEIAANWATALSIILALVVFVIDRRRERRQRELDTVRDLSVKYFEYLQLVMSAPDVSTTETEWSRTLAPQIPVQQSLVVQIAVNMIETAYFMYEDHHSAFRRAQWDGWEAYLRDWCKHPTFVAMWPEVIEQYDENFQQVVRSVFADVHSGRNALLESRVASSGS